MALNDGLISYYKFDTDSGDYKGQNHGSDTSISYGTGKIGSCAQYVSGTSKIVVSEITSLALSEFSISFWFNVNNTTGFKPIFRRSSAFMQGYAVYLSGSNIYGYIGNGADIATPAQSVSSGVWYKGLLRWSNTTKTLSLRINNGTPQTQTTGTNIVNSGVLNFLYDVPNALSGNAKIDEVAIYDRWISDSEDDQLYNSGNGLTYKFENELVSNGGCIGYYKLDNDTNDSIINAVGNYSISQLSSSSYSGFGFSDTDKFASQIISIPRGGKVDSIMFKLHKAGTPTGNIVCKVYTGLGKGLVATSNPIDISTITSSTSGANYTFTFNNFFSVRGKQYYFVLDTLGSIATINVWYSSYNIANGTYIKLSSSYVPSDQGVDLVYQVNCSLANINGLNQGISSVSSAGLYVYDKSASVYKISQSVTTGAYDTNLYGIGFNIRKHGNPSGVLRCKVYTGQGTGLVAVSENVIECSYLPTTFDNSFTYFYFNGESINPNTLYYFTVEFDGTIDSSTNYFSFRSASVDYYYTGGDGYYVNSSGVYSKSSDINFNLLCTGNIHGTGTNVTFTNGKKDNASSFNGTSSLVTIQNNDLLNIRDDISIFCWIKANAQSSTYSAFIEKHYSQSYYFGYGTGKKLSFYYGGTERTSAVDRIVEGAWQHVGVTYNRSSQTAKLYVNGIVVDTFTAFNPTVSGGTTTVLLGKQQTAARWYNGLLDELRIYNITLSDQDVLDLYNSYPKDSNFFPFF